MSRPRGLACASLPCDWHMTARKGRLQFRPPARSLPGQAALWRYTGTIGRLWRLRDSAIPLDCVRLHQQLLLALHGHLFPHLGKCTDDNATLLGFLSVLAGGPRPAGPAQGALQGGPARPVALQPPAGHVDACRHVVGEVEMLPEKPEAFLEDRGDVLAAMEVASPRCASSVDCEVLTFFGEVLPHVGCEVIPSFWLRSSSPCPL